MIVNQDKIKDCSKKLDKMVDFKKIIKNNIVATVAETFDGKAFEIGLNYLNNNSDKIPEKFHNNINDLVDCFLSDDYNNLIDIAQETLMEFGNTKFFDDEIESVWIKYNIIAVAETIKWYANNNKS